jgi:hypothetical protein
MDADAYVGGAITGVADCTDSHFEEVDPAALPKLATSDRATAARYSGKKYYDFKVGEFKSALVTKSKAAYQKEHGDLDGWKLESTAPASGLTAKETKEMNTQKASADAFTRMVWKATT